MKMFGRTESERNKNLLRNVLGRRIFQSGLDDFTDGEFRYLKDNNLIDGFIVDDEDHRAFWLLDEDGNWPLKETEA